MNKSRWKTHCDLTVRLTRNLSSHTDLQTHTGSATDNCVTLTFDLLTSGSMHAKRLPCTVWLPVLMLTAQAVFLLAWGHTDTHTTDTHTKSLMPLITIPTHRIPLVWVTTMHMGLILQWGIMVWLHYGGGTALQKKAKCWDNSSFWWCGDQPSSRWRRNASCPLR